MRDIIEKERRNGAPILSTKAEGGGYYLPGKKREKKEFLNRKLREIKTSLEVYLSIKYEEPKTLDQKTKEFLESL